jgi:hypothetical protein
MELLIDEKETSKESNKSFFGSSNTDQPIAECRNAAIAFYKKRFTA